jgi:hypothetical protein
MDVGSVGRGLIQLDRLSTKAEGEATPAAGSMRGIRRVRFFETRNQNEV